MGMNPGIGIRLTAITAAAISLTACTAAEQPTPQTSSSEFGLLGADGCSPPSPIVGSEVQATTSPGITAYGLLFTASPTSLPGDGTTIKMVVRMTGVGFIAGHLVSPDGRERPLDWGPELHGDSTYRRPGAEWGIGFSFDEVGCWQLRLDGGHSDNATFWFEIGDHR
ncbi:hypothetical protein [Microbacterium deminutum]|uniref:hypothetical protein n=1 Tax=Microbacterium deminutum TaxID=344164 RepID=UPI0031E2A4A3